jgi:SAM-dependent methyltransferase
MLNRALDTLDNYATRAGLVRRATWGDLPPNRAKLYGGRLSRGLPQYRTHVGVTPFHFSAKNIQHDLTDRFPVGDGTIASFQAEDVFEHIELGQLSAVLQEIHRVLVPGGLFRMSVPDYRNSHYVARTVRTDDGRMLFDPGGGGRFEDGKVVGGGHVWFPTIELVRGLFEASPFRDVRYLHYNSPAGAELQAIDYSKGHVGRTPDHDLRTPGEALSIVVDAYK